MYAFKTRQSPMSILYLSIASIIGIEHPVAYDGQVQVAVAVVDVDVEVDAWIAFQTWLLSLFVQVQI